MSDITMARARRWLHEHTGGVLEPGEHAESTGQADVRELRSALLGLPWSSYPDGGEKPTDEVCQVLNDGPWRNDMRRTEGCLPLVMLSEHTAPKGWEVAFVRGILSLVSHNLVHGGKLPRPTARDRLVNRVAVHEGVTHLDYLGTSAGDPKRAVVWAANAACALASITEVHLEQAVGLLLKSHGRDSDGNPTK